MITNTDIHYIYELVKQIKPFKHNTRITWFGNKVLVLSDDTMFYDITAPYMFNESGNLSYIDLEYLISSELGMESNNMDQIVLDKFTFFNVLNNPFYSSDTIKEDINAYSLKAKDGMRLFKITDNVIITIFSGLISINKSDKAYIELYNHPYNSDYFIVKFNIYKSKGKFSYNQFYNCLYLR